MASEGELTEAREWCRKARELLGILKGRRHGNRLDTALAQIDKDLKQAALVIAKLDDESKRQKWQQRYDRFADSFVQTSKLAQKAHESQVNEMAQILSERLEILQHEIRETFYGKSDETDRALQEARQRMADHAVRYEGRYEAMLKEADRQRKALLAMNRPKSADAYETGVVDAIARAKDHAKGKRFSEAIGELVLAEGVHKAQLLQAGRDRAASLAVARDRPVYESQQQWVSARLAAIAALPGAREAHAALVLSVQQIASAAGTGTPFREAFKQLLALEGRLAAAEKIGPTFEGQADETLGGRVVRARQLLHEFTALAGLAQPDVVKAQTEAIASALRWLDAPVADLRAAEDGLDAVQRTLFDAVRVARDAKAGYDQEFAAVTALLETLQARASLDQYQGQLALFRKASSEYAAQQFQRAQQTLLALQRSAGDIERQVTPEYERWRQLLREIEQGFLAPLQEAAALQLKALQGAGSLLARFIAARDYVAGNQHDYAAAVSVADEVKTMVGADDTAGWRQVLKARADLQGQRDLAQQRVAPVRARLLELSQGGGDVAAFNDRLNRLTIDWHAACERTVDRVDLDKAMKVLEEGLDLLFGEVDGILKDPAMLAGSREQAKAAEQAAAFKQTKGEVDKLLRYLAQEAPDDATPFTLRLSQAELDRVAEPERALQAATQLALEVQGRIDEKAGARARVQDEARQFGERFLRAANDLKGKNATIGKAYDPLIHEIEALLGLADSTLADVVQDGRDQLSRFQGRYDQLTLELAKIPQKLKDLAGKLDNPALKTRAPAKAQLLAARLKQELPGRCADDPDRALVQVLGPFEAEIDQAILAATAAEQILQRIKQLAGVLDGEAGQLADAPNLRDDFKARIKAAASVAEGSELAAENELKRLRLMLQAALADPELGAQLEQGVQQRAFEAERLRNDWEAQVELFQLRERQAATSQHSKLAEMLGLSQRNEALFKEMETAFADAQTLAQAQDHLRALDQLALARRLAQQYADNPDSTQISATKNLDKVVAGWRQAAAGFVREMNALIDSVQSKCALDPAYSGTATAIVAPLRELALAFDASAFDAAVQKLGAAKELAARRAAKEAALRPLRRFQDLLAADPVLPLLADSPFAKVSTKALKDAVRDLDVNLKRA